MEDEITHAVIIVDAPQDATVRGMTGAGKREHIRLGVSTCLLGERVRYDGAHKRDAFVCDVLGRFVDWVPVCPELESGLGVPRPPMRLVRDRGGVRLVETASGRDHTRTVERWATHRLRSLRALDLCGYVLKKDSPSCGMARVKLYAGQGRARRAGVGIYASALREAFPDLPIEEEGRLQDPALRENFVERVFAYARLRAQFRGRWTRASVVAFHARHELQLRAHSPEAHRELARMVTAWSRAPRAAFSRRYSAQFMAALARVATRGRNVSALRHGAGRIARALDAAARAELAALIEDYRRGRVPLSAPIARIRHHAREHPVAELIGQTWLEPSREELRLRQDA
jgi:uncharacterized protein YbbK (DUF523 family)/uncharacterized protein YbgA (DUF1722 family)